MLQFRVLRLTVRIEFVYSIKHTAMLQETVYCVLLVFVTFLSLVKFLRKSL